MTPTAQQIAPERSRMVTRTTAKVEIEMRMRELVDLLAVFSADVEIDPRAWRQLLIYVPKGVQETETAREAFKADVEGMKQAHRG